ncbi:hypothetical protein [Halosimplex pelagicum]|uniref:Sulfatase-like hydrolase/transferase n=1 Tax=Halosimplex pelagicum TaxID=869886 RepID=A0A7D5TT67_9EURY|nr:hypothetical protein [Halosimplex pelagicum]QLH81134.1 hypothetical protein HZS54_05535 [Halosimplex pelagicum]
MDTRSRLVRALDTPVLFCRHANRLYHRRLGLRRCNEAGTDPFEADWDTLVVLDACRYDMFERRSTLPGDLERRQSRASTTVEFLRANVDGRNLRDTVYVTANPQLHQHRESIRAEFADIVEVWSGDGWSDEHGTVLPETVTAAALRANEEYPNKRLVVHYMQPHYPFVGADADFDGGDFTDPEATEENVWVQLLQGRVDVDREAVWELYDANLDRALPHVERLLRDLDGKTVVTADHGNMVGERSFPIPFREWGHPRGIYTPELVDVPWLVYEDGPRRTVDASAPAAADGSLDDDVVADRLRDLGYAE